MNNRRRPHRRPSWTYGDGPRHPRATIAIRVGSRRSPRKFHEVQVAGPRDAGRFARLVEDQVRAFPRDPLIIAVDGYQPWLEEIFHSCLEDYWSDIGDLDREVQFAGTMQFPEKATSKAQYVPWTFIVDHMNVPQVYYWSVDMEPPANDDFGLPSIDKFRFRVGVWQIGRGGCRFDRDVSTTIIFTRPSTVCEHVVTELLFGYLYKDQDFEQPREDEEGICWIFSRLYWLLTDWQNIISEITIRLDEAEENSHGRKLPVKLRARMMHNEIDRIYELKEFLHFQSRAFKKLQKLKDDVPKGEQKDPLWGDMDDAVEDLEQFDSTIDGLKERFNNLLELEFNIQSAVQSDNSQFLSIIATLFLPVSFLASLFGMTTVTWKPLLYLYIAIPVVIISAFFALFFPPATRRIQRRLYPVESLRIRLQPRQFTMLGDELPDNADVPGALKAGAGGRRKSKRPAGMDDPSRTRARSRSRLRGEKEDSY